MNRIIVESSSDKEPITAFAYNVGRILDQMIADKTENLELKNNILEELILNFSFYLTGDLYEKYIKHFNIKKDKVGEI